MDNTAFIKALEAICEEKKIDKEVIFEAMELALSSAYKKNFDSKTNVRVDINKTTGEIKVFSVLHVVKEIPEEENIDKYILAKDVKGKKVGDIIEEEVTPKDFGRVSAATAKQVLIQKVREAERGSIMNEFEDKQDELLVGIVSREDTSNYYIDLGRAHGVLPKTELINNETIVMGSSIKVYVTKIEDNGKAPLILLSRTHYGFLKRLLENQIPELKDGTIKLFSIARDPGNRSKIAVYSENSKVDAIGACIGERGSRINNIVKEINNEKIDIILYDKDPTKFIKNSLSPAKDINVIIIDDKNNHAIVIAEGEQLSLAIGKLGQNVRLASRLTKFKIDIKSKEQLEKEGITIKFE